MKGKKRYRALLMEEMHYDVHVQGLSDVLKDYDMTPVTFRQMLQELNVDECTKLRETGTSTLFRTTGRSGSGVIKIMDLTVAILSLGEILTSHKLNGLFGDVAAKLREDAAVSSARRKIYFLLDTSPQFPGRTDIRRDLWPQNRASFAVYTQS